MAHKYIVKFAHTSDDEVNGHGWGSASIETDEPVKTKDHLQEVARIIGRKNKFTSVAILELVEEK